MTKNDLRNALDYLLMIRTLESVEMLGLDLDKLKRDYEQVRRLVGMTDDEAWRLSVFTQIREQWLDTVLERKLQEADDER